MYKHWICLAFGIALYHGAYRLDQYAIRVWDGGINTIPGTGRAYVQDERYWYEDPAIMAQLPEGKQAIRTANMLAEIARVIRDCSRIVIALGSIPIVFNLAKKMFARLTTPKDPPCATADES
jgi:hypothetical protein